MLGAPCRMLNLAKAETHKRRASDLTQNVLYPGKIDAARKRHEVRVAARSAIARSKVLNRNERVRKLRQRLAPPAFERFIRYRVEDGVHFGHGAQIVDVPVEGAGAAQMSPHASPQAPCSVGTAHVEVMSGREVRLPQATDHERLRKRNV